MSRTSQKRESDENQGNGGLPTGCTPNKGSHPRQTNLGPGNCLIHLESEQLLAVDIQAAAYLGIDPENLENASLRKIIPDLTTQQWASVFDQKNAQDRSFFATIHRQPTPNFAAELIFTRLRSRQQTWLLLTINLRNPALPTDLQCDALTGLPDRRQLAFHHETLRPTTGGKPTPFALLFMDLDNFKPINDQLGHALGDQILVTLASRWQKCLRDQDLVVRYGGDEFVVLLAGITSRQEAQPILARLTAATVKPIPVDDKQIQVHVSIGIAVADASAKNLDALIAAADRDMYTVKAKRKAESLDDPPQ